MPFLEVIRGLHWKRGLRAGVAVAVAMIVCQMMGKPMGWAALGGFEAILVDNGGPYRSRFNTILTVLIGGVIACVAGTLAAQTLLLSVIITGTFCFAVTFARVISQPLASTSVVILVIYFAGFGSGTHTLDAALANALLFMLGGIWAAALSLFLWPIDPFRPARNAVAECYAALSAFTATVRDTVPHGPERAAQRQRMNELQRQMRRRIETARSAISSVGARTTARTIRAGSLTVLLETIDILFAGTIRWTELFETAPEQASQQALASELLWLSRAEVAIERGLRQRPADGGASFAPEGSDSLEHLRGHPTLNPRNFPAGSLLAHLAADQRDLRQNLEIAFESVRALWSGVEFRSSSTNASRKTALTQAAVASLKPSPMDAIRANWTTNSVMMRHALRMLVVSVVDVLLLHQIHVRHGSWLAMTSIIVLQPYSSGTLRRGVQRVGGTIAGGLLAAILAVSVHNEASIIAAITITSILTLATYAVDYAWYCFFLTPTFVLMSLPYLHDWNFAGVRMLNTLLGALVAVAAMRLLWPESERIQLGRMLSLGASADAAYVRAMLRYWAVPAADRIVADREILAPARRKCGLALNDAEETLDRLFLEPRIPLRIGEASAARLEEALTFVIYLWRVTRAVTTLAVIGPSAQDAAQRSEIIAQRLEALSVDLTAGQPAISVHANLPALAQELDELGEQQLRRMERQAGVLERSAAAFIAGT
jgi:uncharacterized membrane protein YccC